MSNPIKSYQSVSAATLLELDYKIQTSINRGYQPHSSAYQAVIDGEYLFIQAMVKESKYQDKKKGKW